MKEHEDIRKAARLMEASDAELNRAHSVIRDGELARPRLDLPDANDMTMVQSSVTVDDATRYPDVHQYLVLRHLMTMGDSEVDTATYRAKHAVKVRSVYPPQLFEYRKAASFAEAIVLLHGTDQAPGDHEQFAASNAEAVLRRAEDYARLVESVMEAAQRIKPAYDAAHRYIATLPQEA